MNLAKFLITPFLQNTSERLLLFLQNMQLQQITLINLKDKTLTNSHLNESAKWRALRAWRARVLYLLACLACLRAWHDS